MSGPDAAPGWLRPLLTAARGATGVDLRRLPPAPGSTEAAVLVLFGEEPAHGPDLLFIERSPHLRNHAGQPAFPGGKVDPEDEGPVAAALREAAEETGLDPAGVDVLEVLSPLGVPPSGFAVTPVLAWWREPTEVRPMDTAEVAAVVRVPIAELVDPANRVQVRSPAGYTGPAFEVRDLLIWGFTAALADRILALGGWERPWDRDRVRDLPDEALRLALRQRREVDGAR